MARTRTIGSTGTAGESEGECSFQVSKNRGRGIFLREILRSGSEWIDLTTLAVDCGHTGSFLGCEMAGHGNWMNDKARPRLGGVNPFEFSSDIEGVEAGRIRVNPQVEFTVLGEGTRRDYVRYKISRRTQA